MVGGEKEEEKTAAAAMGSPSPAAAVAVTTAAVAPHAPAPGGEGGPTERRRDARADQRRSRYLAARPRLPPSHRLGRYRHHHRRRAAATEPRRRHIRTPPLRAPSTSHRDSVRFPAFRIGRLLLLSSLPLLVLLAAAVEFGERAREHFLLFLFTKYAYFIITVHVI